MMKKLQGNELNEKDKLIYVIYKIEEVQVNDTGNCFEDYEKQTILIGYIETKEEFERYYKLNKDKGIDINYDVVSEIKF